MYDGIDRSELKDVVSIIKGDADEDVEEDTNVVESDMKTNGKRTIKGKENTPADLQDSNENENSKNNNTKKKNKPKKAENSPKAVVSDDKESEAKGIEAINMKVLPTVAPVEPIAESVENREKTPVVQNIRDRNATAHSLTISEAFADDDVIEEFRAEKVAFTD